ncbi:putative cyclase-domain-containing protein [Dichotomopilus funicola]|uniref:Cyclase-domain-containing protein n=1 Tax=Dichotomopilus funicola TaxID=1934379 RepID=A0AAN6UV67_9PEZI|nr:putative cyclase-domain-containing protein [Dichotomopilus funicola]
MATNSFPDFDDLPKVEGQPQGCAWGVFDKDGKKDVFGTLNFLTPEIVAAASKEVKDGISISLNWPLNGIKIPFPNRKPPVHTPHRLRDIGIDYEGWDDELAINTQFSSQWDSLLHVTTDGLAYNGFQPTVEGLSVQSTAENPLPTIEHWHSRGALAGRGVLIDWKAYQEQTTGTPYHPLDGHRITVEDIEKVAAFQGVEFKPGDILIVRTGYTEVLEDPKPEDMAKFAKFGGGLVIPGVHGSEETARWLWNRRFAAVAGDAHAFEAVPGLKPDGTQLPLSELVLHPWLLTQFGMSIGELWDLKAVAAYAKKTGRYSFLLTSAPLNHPGLVASPPNAIALF